MDDLVSFSLSTLKPAIIALVPVLLVLVVAILLIRLVQRKPAVEVEGERFRDQLSVLMIVLGAVVGMILTLPLEDSMRGQLLTLLGLLLTAVITLSSPTIAANIMAGVMLRSLRSFTPGDFIHVGDFFGRVTEQDLFHVEIQTEDRDLLTIPNTYLVTNPVKVVHARGTLISAEVSLGYDVSYPIVEEALLAAVEAADLEDGFVYIMQLGDFSVVYRVSGSLTNVKHILSSRSKLRRQMIYQLHRRQVEIVSPNFMNQRQISQPVIPKDQRVVSRGESESPEEWVFDKAERAQQLKELRETYKELKEELNGAAAEDATAIRNQRRLQAIERAIAMLER